MGRNSPCEGFPGELRNSRPREGFPGGKEFRKGRIPGGKEFPVVRISRWNRFLDEKDFRVIRISSRKKISQWQEYPRVKDFRAEKFLGSKDVHLY